MLGIIGSILGSTGVLVFLVGSVALMIAYAVAVLCASAVIFSRVAFSLAAAFVAAQCGMTLVADNGFLNYIAWAFIIMGIVYFLSTLPRLDMALKFLCTTLLSVVIVMIVMMLLGGIIAALINTEFVFSTGYEILVKIICTLFSFFYMFWGKKPHYDSPTNLILYNLERGLASLMYGIAGAFLFIPIGESWELSVLLVLFVLIIISIGAYLADVFLAGKDIFGLEKDKEINMPK